MPEFRIFFGAGGWRNVLKENFISPPDKADVLIFSKSLYCKAYRGILSDIFGKSGGWQILIDLIR